MIDIYSITIIFFITFFIIIIFAPKKLRKNIRQYIKTKDILDDIVFSFKKDWENLEQRINNELVKTETKLEKTLDEISELPSKIKNIETNIKNLKDKNELQEEKYLEMEREVQDLKKNQKKFDKPTDLETLEIIQENMPNFSEEFSIPVKTGNVVSSLTETERKILNVLLKEGRMTAPQIKKKIGLTREHTARLMKRLYNNGYIERRTNDIPYVYFLKKEMKELLRKNNIRL